MKPLFLLNNRFALFSILVLVMFMAFVANCLMTAIDAHSAQVTLQWDPNTELDLAGYKIYYGYSSRNYTSSIDVGRQTSCILTNLEDGKNYYFAATAYDISDNESGFSNEVIYNTPTDNPLPPTTNCTYLIYPRIYSFMPYGGVGTVRVTTQIDCSWSASSNASWLIITSNSNGTGTSTINYSVLANPGGSSRIGTLTISGQVFTVTQY